MKYQNKTVMILLVSLVALISCKPTELITTKTRPPINDLAKNQLTALKYYLPKKILTFYCVLHVQGKVATEDGMSVLVDKAKITLGDTLKLYEDEDQGEGYYVINRHKKKSVMQTSVGLTYYGNGILKGINAQSNNLAIDIAQVALSAATSAANSAICAFPGVRDQTRDTSFAIPINKKIELGFGKTTDTIDLRQILPKLTNKIFFVVSLDNAPRGVERLDSVKNGFIYTDPKYINTVVKFHNPGGKEADAVVLSQGIFYPQFGEKQVLFLPQGFSDGSVIAGFTPEGILLDVSYVKNKESQTRLQTISNMVNLPKTNTDHK